MKKLKILFVFATILTLSACSFIGEVNESIEYMNAAKDHIEILGSFAEEAPQLIQEATANPEVKRELETQLLSLKTEIEEFINMNDVPAVAETIHQELVNKNEVLLTEINNLVENGQLALDELKNSDLVTTINEVRSLADQIESLNQ